MILPDQPHINEIRRRLWSGREYGRAAVMIGSGFSKNAEPISGNVSGFPLWNDLAKAMYNDLHPEHAKEVASGLASKDDFARISPLRLASEYELTFGRNGLDDFLLRSIQEGKYRPGRLHELLLSLPWSDVFTTNYDTLLERTLPQIYDRRYDCIATASDIPTSAKPRLVKLHGSFPSHRPFIFTEEDYRTYPRKFAPFVNTVQQSLMENVFCLLGFSASDPNFLAWAGWVRDHLGDSTPYLYLCGLLELSSSERKLFEQRRIIPVDLSPLFPKNKYPDPSVRHSKATEWFLFSLMAGAGHNVMSWPTLSTRNCCSQEPSADLPDVFGMPVPATTSARTLPVDIVGAQDVVELTLPWRETRERYPGWIICPRESRVRLWRETQHWVPGIIACCDQLEAPNDLSLVYELNWRLERCLNPLWSNLVEKIETIVARYNPFPHICSVDGAVVRPDQAEFTSLDWSGLAQHWVDLCFALARIAREDQDESRFARWTELLGQIADQSLEWRVRLANEICMYHLIGFDMSKTRDCLKQWPECDDLPYWNARRASILAELGDTKEAHRIAESTLSTLRSRLSLDSSDFALLSQEGCAMLILRSIATNRMLRGDHTRWVREIQQFTDRWDRLQSFRCNPLSEIELVCADFSGSVQLPQYERKVGFDPGVITETRRIGGSNDREEYAFNLLRMVDDLAIPITIGMSTNVRDTLVQAARAAETNAQFWSLSILLRARKEDAIKEWFDRGRIARLEQEHVDRLFSLFSKPLMQSVLHYGNEGGSATFQQDIPNTMLAYMPELLSRLCFRLSAEQLEESLDLACKLYMSPVCRKSIGLHSPLDLLFKRLLDVMPESMLLSKLPVLLSLPIPGEAGFDVAVEQYWPEPLGHLERRAIPTSVALSDKSQWHGPIERLVALVATGTEHTRARATQRLASLSFMNCLSDSQAQAYGEALWCRTDAETNLPQSIGMLPSALLHLPEPTVGMAKTVLRKYFLDINFIHSVHQEVDENGKRRLSFTGSDGTIQQIYSLYNTSLRLSNDASRYIDWTEKESALLLKKVVVWWENEKLGLDEDLSFIFGNPMQNISAMLQLLSTAILPRLASSSRANRRSAADLLSEMAQSGVVIIQALPALLLLDCVKQEQALKQLHDGLLSGNRETIIDSVRGIYEWQVLSSAEKLEPVPVILIDTLVQIISMRCQPAINSALQCLADMISIAPSILNDNRMQLICSGLSFLAKETDLSAPQNTVGLPISLHGRPNTRRLAATVAYRLWQFHAQQSLELPEIIDAWRMIAQSDPLPEVRDAWPTESTVK